MKNILFIPFSAKEENFSLFLRALNWFSLIEDAEITEKIPEIIIYRRPDEIDSDYNNYEEAGFKFSLENCPENSSVYILADGMGDPNHVLNSNVFYRKYLDENPYVLSMKSIAWRLKESGFTETFAKKVKSLKLYVCEERDSNQALALNLAHALGEEYHFLNLAYYKAKLSIPSHFTSDETTFLKKGAIKDIIINNKLVSRKTSKASEERHLLNIGESMQLARREEEVITSAEDDAMPYSFYLERLQNLKQVEFFPSIIEDPEEDIENQIETEYSKMDGIVVEEFDDEIFATGPSIINEFEDRPSFVSEELIVKQNYPVIEEEEDSSDEYFSTFTMSS